jgi:hypothetical protein
VVFVQNELATCRKNKNITDLLRGIDEFKTHCKPKINMGKDENGDLLAKSHNNLNRRKNYFFRILNAHRFSDVRQVEIHAAEQLIPEPSPFEVEISIANLQVFIKFRQN